MKALVIDRKILPEPIFSYIHSEKIRVFEENGNIILSPIVEIDKNESLGPVTKQLTGIIKLEKNIDTKEILTNVLMEKYL